MISKELEELIRASIVDGVLTSKEKNAIYKRSIQENVDVDEIEIYIQSLLQKQEQEANEKSLMGSVKRCPSCGGIVEPGWALCPHCGFAFDVDNRSSIAMELQNKLEGVMDANTLTIVR